MKNKMPNVTARKHSTVDPLTAGTIDPLTVSIVCGGGAPAALGNAAAALRVDELVDIRVLEPLVECHLQRCSDLCQKKGGGGVPRGGSGCGEDGTVQTPREAYAAGCAVFG